MERVKAKEVDNQLKNYEFELNSLRARNLELQNERTFAENKFHDIEGDLREELADGKSKLSETECQLQNCKVKVEELYTQN